MGEEVESSKRRGSLVPFLILLIVLLLLAVVILFFRGDRSTPAPAAARQDDSVVALTLLQLNDVYELTPVGGGAEGGLARVAALRNELRRENPNTFTVLAGDLLNPSALSTAVVDGERLDGRQMVDVMNGILDYSTFGNHEFDLSQDHLTKRLAESRFEWFSSNVTDTSGQPLPGIPKNVVFTVENDAGEKVQVGMFGVTVASPTAAYVQYQNPIETAREQVAELRSEADIIVAVTHLPVQDDVDLVQAVPGIDLVLGGHEHENMELLRGPDLTPIYKADANARTVQIHELRWDTEKEELSIVSLLRRVTDADPEDPETAKQVDRWVDAAFDGFRSQGFDPERVVATVNEDLDGRESSVRNHPTRLTDLIALSMVRAAPSSELAFFNSGSIRIDDVLPPGDVTEYDIIRILPFGGTVQQAQIRGDVLKQVLDQGRTGGGTGAFLQTANVALSDNSWLVNGAPLDPARNYSVALNDFLLSGRANLPFLTRDNPGVTNVTDHGDVRKALIAELEALPEEVDPAA